MKKKKEKFEVVRNERIDEYGHYTRSVMETHNKKEDAIVAMNEYNENENNYEVQYFVRVVRP